MPETFGPFHRRSAPYQTAEDAEKQKSSGEIWGKPMKLGGKFPYVKAYSKPLCFPDAATLSCHDGDGIEFTTEVMPAQKNPNGVILWSMEEFAPAGCRKIDDETIALPATIYKVVYR